MIFLSFRIRQPGIGEPEENRKNRQDSFSGRKCRRGLGPDRVFGNITSVVPVSGFRLAGRHGIKVPRMSGYGLKQVYKKRGRSVHGFPAGRPPYSRVRKGKGAFLPDGFSGGDVSGSGVRSGNACAFIN